MVPVGKEGGRKVGNADVEESEVFSSLRAGEGAEDGVGVDVGVGLDFLGLVDLVLGGGFTSSPESWSGFSPASSSEAFRHAWIRFLPWSRVMMGWSFGVAKV